MKILEVLDTFYPNVDGPVSVMVSLAQSMKAFGHEVDLLVPDNPKHRVEIEGLKIFRCKSVKYSNYRAAVPAFDGKLKKIFKNGGYDIIHLHSPVTLGKYSLRMAKKYGVPTVMTVHTKFREEIYSRTKSGALRKFMLGYVVKTIDGCNAITSVSRGMVDELKSYGSEREDVEVIYNGTDMPAMAADASAVANLRAELGLDNKFVFMFVGRLTELKNVQFSLRVLKIIKQRGINNFRFIIVGDGEYAKRLKTLSDEYGLSEEVIFAGKITDRKTIAEYYSACDAMLFPSVFDNSSIAMQEAAANRLPAVTIKGSCSSELIYNGVNGFALDNDETVWADNLIALIQNPERAEKAGEGALKTIYSDWDEIAKNYLKLYERLLAEDKKRV